MKETSIKSSHLPKVKQQVNSNATEGRSKLTYKYYDINGLNVVPKDIATI